MSSAPNWVSRSLLAQGSLRRRQEQKLWPDPFARVAYLRGQAYLAGRQGQEAALEFQKILDHRGVVLNSLLGALAHVGLARAYTLQGDTSKARVCYENFFALWKDADRDIPILKRAEAEYGKLQ